MYEYSAFGVTTIFMVRVDRLLSYISAQNAR
jgi:hypothetical protein